MSFISYAQNYEDVILWRALRDVERGFYVDVGAADPTELSVTRAFYDRGWSGINVEPLEEYFDKLEQARPRDTNLKVAAGREAGARTLHTIAGTGLSTFDTEIAARHQADGWKTCETVVSVLPLAKILEDCAPPIIHFLKIDVEGVEIEVLEGLNLGRVRPWIILIEATEPFSTVSTRDNWEHLFTNQGYEFAYFDGLNCFYVPHEKEGLKERLAVPPNVFDDFIRWQEWSCRQKAAALEQELAGRESTLHTLQSALQSEQADTASLRNALQLEQDHAANLQKALHAAQANAARLGGALQAEQDQTRRLREHTQKLEAELATPALKPLVKRLREAGNRLTGGGVRAFAERTLKASLHRAASHPRLVAIGRSVLRPFPAFATNLQRLATTPNPATIQTEHLPLGSSTDSDTLPASARLIYARLHKVISEGNVRNRGAR
jgi:FkbM family methyltransferase